MSQQYILRVSSEQSRWLVSLKDGSQYEITREYVYSLPDNKFRHLLDFLVKLPRMRYINPQTLIDNGFKKI